LSGRAAVLRDGAPPRRTTERCLAIHRLSETGGNEPVQGETHVLITRVRVAACCTLAVSACGGGGGGGPAAPPPTVSLAASATDVRTDGPVTLTWSSTNASSCSASGAWSGSLATSGSQSQTVGGTSNYAITCTGGGGSASGAATVTAWNAPASNISADATSILTNNDVALTWSAQNANACTGADGLSGSL